MPQNTFDGKSTLVGNGLMLSVTNSDGMDMYSMPHPVSCIPDPVIPCTGRGERPRKMWPECVKINVSKCGLSGPDPQLATRQSHMENWGPSQYKDAVLPV